MVVVDGDDIYAEDVSMAIVSILRGYLFFILLFRLIHKINFSIIINRRFMTTIVVHTDFSLMV